MIKQYSFVRECGMCAAGLASGGTYETPAKNTGNYFDVYGDYSKKKKKPRKKYTKHIPGTNIL